MRMHRKSGVRGSLELGEGALGLFADVGMPTPEEGEDNGPKIPWKPPREEMASCGQAHPSVMVEKG